MSCKRQRTDNFSTEEKALLIDLIKENSIIESKDADPKMLKIKQKAWENISHIFKTRGYERETKSLKKLYFRLKQSAKEHISSYRREQKKTAGGISPVGEPTDMDWAIADVCPIDFKEDASDFDSDAIYDFQVVLPDSQDRAIGLIDPFTGEIQIVDEASVTESTTTESNPNPVQIEPPPTTSNTTSNNSRKTDKKKAQMSAYEQEIIEMNKKHIEKKIENEKKIHEKEMEILEAKLEYRKLKLELLKAKCNH